MSRVLKKIGSLFGGSSSAHTSASPSNASEGKSIDASPTLPSRTPSMSSVSSISSHSSTSSVSLTHTAPLAIFASKRAVDDALKVLTDGKLLAEMKDHIQASTDLPGYTSFLEAVDLDTPPSKLAPEKRQDALLDTYLAACKALLFLHQSVLTTTADSVASTPLLHHPTLMQDARKIIGYLYASAGDEAKEIRNQVRRETERRIKIEGWLAESKQAQWECVQSDGSASAFPETENAIVEKAFCDFLRTGKETQAKYTFQPKGAYYSCTYSVTFDEFRDKHEYEQLNHRFGSRLMVRRVVNRPSRQNETETKKQSEPQETTPEVYTECQICYSEFENHKKPTSESGASDDAPDSKQTSSEGDESCVSVRILTCGHEMTCRTCFATYVQGKLKNDEVLPYIRCPHPECKLPITADALYDAGLAAQIYFGIAKVHLQKTLARNPDWVGCSNSNCCYGFLHREDLGVVKKLTCALCNTTQDVSKKGPEMDEDFQRMRKEGTIRLCPKCNFPAMKEYGMCNIMDCGKCGIFWNWRTYDTAPDSNTLKQIARNQGTLWEPGNLEYQQRLQRENLPEFIKLLKRNGIDYDPNYRRGQ